MVHVSPHKRGQRSLIAVSSGPHCEQWVFTPQVPETFPTRGSLAVGGGGNTCPVQPFPQSAPITSAQHQDTGTQENGRLRSTDKVNTGNQKYGNEQY